MTECTEVAVFKVEPENRPRVIELSNLIFLEMNADEQVIIHYKILQNTDKPNVICWNLSWLNAQSAKITTQKWPSFNNTKEFQSLVVENIYYGHFIPANVV